MFDSTLADQMAFIVPVAAAGWAFLYWLLGGGVFGAIILFIILKMFGK